MYSVQTLLWAQPVGIHNKSRPQHPWKCKSDLKLKYLNYCCHLFINLIAALLLFLFLLLFVIVIVMLCNFLVCAATNRLLVNKNYWSSNEQTLKWKFLNTIGIIPISCYYCLTIVNIIVMSSYRHLAISLIVWLVWLSYCVTVIAKSTFFPNSVLWVKFLLLMWVEVWLHNRDLVTNF